jgi:type III secretion system FlhB-like substrate exporter
MKSAKSVALRYEKDLPAPFVAAKGAGHLAAKLVELAQEHGVPVMPAETLAESLFYLEIGDFIPESFYRAVAELLAFVLRTESPTQKSVPTINPQRKSRK